jgi:hypothetical protein
MKCSLCVQCLDPEVVWDQSHRSDCRVSKAKFKDQMEKHKSAMQKKGTTLAFTSWIMHSSESGTLSTAAPVKLVKSIEEFTRKLTRAEQKSSKNQTFKVVPPLLVGWCPILHLFCPMSHLFLAFNYFVQFRTFCQNFHFFLYIILIVHFELFNLQFFSLFLS